MSDHPPDSDEAPLASAARFPVTPLPCAIGLLMAVGRLVASVKVPASNAQEAVRVFAAAVLMAFAHFVVGYVLVRYLVALRPPAAGYADGPPFARFREREDVSRLDGPYRSNARSGATPRTDALGRESLRMCLLGICCWALAAGVAGGFAGAGWALLPLAAILIAAVVRWQRGTSAAARPRRPLPARTPQTPPHRAALHEGPGHLVQ